MLLISRPQDLWKLLPYVWLINCGFHLFRSSASSFSSQYFSCFSNHLGAVFSFFFLLLSLPSSVLQWHHVEGNFFSEYDQCNWIFYIGYYLGGFFYYLKYRFNIWTTSSSMDTTGRTPLAPSGPPPKTAQHTAEKRTKDMEAWSVYHKIIHHQSKILWQRQEWTWNLLVNRERAKRSD